MPASHPEEKIRALGVIEKVRFGPDIDRGFGLHMVLRTTQGNVDTSLTSIKTVENWCIACKVDDINKLIGKPVEVLFGDKLLVDVRILSECIL